MKQFWLSAVALLALSMAAPAVAADLPAQPYSKSPILYPAMYDWSGLYVGFNGGWGSSHKCWDLNTGAGGVFAASEGCHNATGGFAGAQIGYRLQSGSWVFGIEAQGDWANMRGSNTSPVVGAPFINRSRIDALGLFTGQVGYAVDTALFYVKGGAALAADRYDGFNTATGVTFDAAPGENRWGGVIGTGVEYSFMPDWSVAVEYDHLFMGARTLDFTSLVAPGGFAREDRIRQDADLVSVRINYRWGGPVIAKY